MSGRPMKVRIGASASVVDWLVLPKLAGSRSALGEVVLELGQSRTLDAARCVADGRLDFAIIRQDPAPAGMKCHPLGKIGYSMSAPMLAWKGDMGIDSLFSKHPCGELMPGGQFSRTYAELLAAKGWSPRVVVRAGSFQQLARLVRGEGLAAVLPKIAEAEFDPAKIEGTRNNSVSMDVMIRFLGGSDGPRWIKNRRPQPLRSQRMVQHTRTIFRRAVVTRLKLSDKLQRGIGGELGISHVAVWKLWQQVVDDCCDQAAAERVGWQQLNFASSQLAAGNTYEIRLVWKQAACRFGVRRTTRLLGKPA